MLKKLGMVPGLFFLPKFFKENSIFTPFLARFSPFGACLDGEDHSFLFIAVQKRCEFSQKRCENRIFPF